MQVVRNIITWKFRDVLGVLEQGEIVGREVKGLATGIGGPVERLHATGIASHDQPVVVLVIQHEGKRPLQVGISARIGRGC